MNKETDFSLNGPFNRDMLKRTMPETALVVDDEPSIRSLVSAVLLKQGFHVLEAKDGQAAYELLKGGPGAVQLIVTDIVMPRMDGVTLGQKVQAEYPNIKVLYISAYITDPSTKKIPASRFLAKPFTPDALVRRVRRLCA